MEPDFKEGDQVLMSTLNFNNLKGPKKMRDSFLGPFNNPTPPDIVEVEDFPGPVSKIRLNGKDKGQYLVRFKHQTADKDKWLGEDAITDGNLHLATCRASRRTEQSHQG
ncbi:hypothetical protein O181_057452 [Austropuccinia psidii MF-1]|uniref:Chromo domain-containing protein n=1 Tax=Austropuccinia psidii MF-1 TaxID=1389203 RepID=A0A9Q3HVG6_9BASI|nr:hypothetical protein [Austropuccinia psidii MF-1]